MICQLMSIKLQKAGSITLEDESNIKVRGDEDVQLVKLLRGNFGVCISWLNGTLCCTEKLKFRALTI